MRVIPKSEILDLTVSIADDKYSPYNLFMYLE